MADLDSLNIQISATSKKATDAIDNLIQDLGRLNAALNNYSANSSYIKGLVNLTTGLSSVAKATNSLDADKIKGIASAIGTLATKGTNLSKLNSVFSGMGAEVGQMAEKTKQAVKEISGSFGITSSKGIKELTDNIDKFYKSIDNPTALKSASEGIRDVVKEYANLGKETDKNFEKVRNWLSNSNLAIPKGAAQELVDDFSSIRGKLGIGTTFNDLHKGIGLDVVAEEMNQVLGTNFDSSSALNALRSINEYLQKGSGAFDTWADGASEAMASSEQLTAILDKLYASIGKVREVSSIKTDANGMLDVSGLDVDDFGLPEEKIEAATEAISELNTVSQETQTIGNPFEGLLIGLNSLEGLTVDGEQFAGLKTISDSLGKLAGTYAEKASVTLPRIASGMAAFSGLNIPDNGPAIASLAAGISKLGGVKAVAAQDVGKIAEGLRQLSFVKIRNLDEISALATALGKFGYKSAQAAITNMPQLAVAFNQLMTTLSQAPQVSEETIRLAEAMGQLATASRNVGSGTKGASNGINFLKGAIKASFPTFKRAQKHTMSLASVFGKLYASYFLVIRAVRGLGNAIDTSSKLTEVQNVVSTVFGDMTENLDSFAETSMNDFGMAELSAKQYASRFQSMGSAMGITSKQVEKSNDYLSTALVGQKREIEGVEDSYANLGNSMADMSVNLTKLVGDYASFFNMDYDDVAKDFESIFTGQTRPMRIYGIDLTNATLKEWALKNGLDADIKSMTQAEKTMLRYQYVMAHSGKVMNDFAITADTWANVVRTIGQQFVKLGSIIGTGLINTFKPVLIGFRNFMNTFLELTQKGLNAIGKLLGWQIEIEEVGVSMDDTMEDYADDLGDAADNAKKLNSQLRGIDELNNLTTNKGKGSGSGDLGLSGVSGATGGGISFVPTAKPYESDIESWFDLGSSIRDKILDGFKAISWDDISDKVKLNAEGFANLINGILTRDANGDNLGGVFGSFLAHGINLGFDWLVTFSKTLDWSEVGGNISQFVNKFFENLDAKDAADTIDNFVQGIWKMFKTALFGDKEKGIEGIDKQLVAKKIAEFFSSIDYSTQVILIKALKFKIATAVIGNIAKWFLGEGIKTLFINWLSGELSGGSVSPTISIRPKFTFGLGLANSSAGAAMSSTEYATLGEVWGSGIGAKIATGFAAAFASLAGTRIGLGLGDVISELADDETFSAGVYDKYYKPFGMIEMFKDWFDALHDYIFELDGLKEDFNTIIDDMFGPGSMFQSIFGEGSMFGDITGWIDDGFLKLKEIFTGHSGGGGGTSFGEIGEEEGKKFIDGVEIGIEEEAPNLESTTGFYGFGAGTGMTDGMKLSWTLFGSWWKTTGIYKWWTEDVAPWFTKERWSKLGENIKKGISDKWNEFATWWSNTAMYKWWNEKVTPWFSYQKWNDLFDNVGKGIKDGIKAGINGAIGVLNMLIGGVEDTVNGAIDGLNTLIDLAQKIPGVDKIISDVNHITLPRISQFEYGGYPQTGSLFFAGEAGAELLGTVNGRTTVASNGEITGISDTIRQTSNEEIQLLRQQNQLLQGILQKEFGISKGELFKSVRSSASEYHKMTGNPAFA